MSVIKINRRKNPKILFGILLNNLESNLYYAISQRNLANEILKESLKINPRRLISVVEVVDGDGEVHDLLVVFDLIVTEKEELKMRDKLKVEKFNFHIFNFNRKEEIDIEKMAKQFKGL